ncbi:hypothetical protein BD560DRAFT_335052, partial [Blakeslea trispora]
KIEIRSAICSLQAAGNLVTIDAVVTQLTDYLVKSHDGSTSLFIYKRTWVCEITSLLRSMNIAYVCTSQSFDKECTSSKSTALPIASTEGYATTSITPAINISAPRNTATTTITTTTTTTTTNGSPLTKQTKLSSVDKLLIKDRFEKLEESKMWKLSTGTYVEKQMQKFALACNFEHPVHSFVLDTTDCTWEKYFTDEEMIEIRSHRLKKLANLPTPLNEYISQLQQLADVPSLKQQLGTEKDDTDCEWLRNCLLNYLNLFKCGYLPLTDQTEGDMMRRVWFFIDTAFDTSKISCRGGEKSSKSSSSSRNNKRTLAGENAMQRKLVGRKLDMVYFRQSSEYGSCECGRYEEQTKELCDGGFKMAKVSKDMLVDLCRKAPSAVRDFSVVGFLLFGAKFTLMLYDLPAGYVCRGNSLSPIYLPEDVEDINIKLIDMLSLTFRARLIMEGNNRLVRQSRSPLDVVGLSGEKEVVFPCFQSEENHQKRRRTDANAAPGTE